MNMKNLYLLYLLMIPLHRILDIRMPFSFMATFVALLGIMIHTANNVQIDKRCFAKWSKQFAFMIVYTVMAALVSYSSWGAVNGETTLDCIIGTCAFIVTMWSSLYFNYVCLSKYVTLDDVAKILKIQNFMFLSIGFIQLAILYGIAGPITSIYDSIAAVTCIVDSSFLTGVNRGVCLFGMEPSSATFALVIAVPFALMYEFDKKFKPMTISWLIILGLSGSSQTMVSLLIILACYAMLKMRHHLNRWFYLATFSFGMIMALFYTFSDGVTTMAVEGSLGYIIYGKALNFGDYSVMAREATVINDIKIFFSYPLTGIGDGIQGMLYNQNVPVWCQYSKEVDEVMSGSLGVANGGGNFFPSYLSGYGIIGLTFIFSLVRRYRTDIKMLENSFFWSNIQKISMVLFLMAAWQTVSVFNNEYMMFILALPYAALNSNNTKHFENSIV